MFVESCQCVSMQTRMCWEVRIKRARFIVLQRIAHMHILQSEYICVCTHPFVHFNLSHTLLLSMCDTNGFIVQNNLQILCVLVHINRSSISLFQATSAIYI